MTKSKKFKLPSIFPTRKISIFSEESDEYDELTPKDCNDEQQSPTTLFQRELMKSYRELPMITKQDDMLKRPTYLVSPTKVETKKLKSTTMAEALDEGPTLKKFVNKIKFQKRVGNILMSGREKQINELKSVCNKACDKLKTTPRTSFIRQIGKASLNLGNECLTTKDLNAVISTMIEDKFTISLNLSGNNLNGSIAHYIDTLLTKNTKITELDLSDNNFADDFLPVLMNTFSNNKHLVTLNLSGNHFTDVHARHIAEMIERNSSIEMLNLSHNELGEKGGIHLGAAIASNQHLTHLDLSWNHLRGKGAASISRALLKNTELTNLDVSWNGFGFEGCIEIGHALKHNTTLEDLDISCNRIHAPALFELMKGLINNKGLQKIKIGPNPIPAIATTPFICKVRDNPSMSAMFIDMTGVVVEEDFQSVIDTIKENRPEFIVKYDCMLPVHKGPRKREALSYKFTQCDVSDDVLVETVDHKQDKENATKSDANNNTEDRLTESSSGKKKNSFSSQQKDSNKIEGKEFQEHHEGNS